MDAYTLGKQAQILIPSPPKGGHRVFDPAAYLASQKSPMLKTLKTSYGKGSKKLGLGDWWNLLSPDEPIPKLPNKFLRKARQMLANAPRKSMKALGY